MKFFLRRGRSKPAAKLCSIDNCPEPSRSKGLCNKHYRRLLTHGDPHSTKELTYHGETKSIRAWAKKLGITHNNLALRLRNWSIEDAMTRSPKGRTLNVRLKDGRKATLLAADWPTIGQCVIADMTNLQIIPMDKLDI